MATYHPDSSTLLTDDSILEYVLETTVYPREHERLRELRHITQQHAKSFMGSSPDQMQFFSILLKMIGANNTIEVGVFTGYSLLTTALALPAAGKSVDRCNLTTQQRNGGRRHRQRPQRGQQQPAGASSLVFTFPLLLDEARWTEGEARDSLARPSLPSVVAIDANREYYELGRPVIEKAGVAHKVDFREGDGLAELDGILSEDGGARAGTFDFAYADADKLQYAGYHERLLRLVRVGGAIAYDNTLWGGSVAMPRDKPGSSEYDRLVRDSFVEFNAAVAADDRVEACIVPIADGVTLCRRRVR